MDPEAASSVLIAAARSGDAALFDRFLDALRRADSPREKRLLLLALGSFQDESQEERTEGLLLSDKVNFHQWLTAMTARPARPEFAAKRVQFVEEHIDAILERVNPEQRDELLTELPNVAEGACSEDVRSGVESFFRPRLASVSGAEASLADVLTSISACARRRVLQASSLREYVPEQ